MSAPILNSKNQKSLELLAKNLPQSLILSVIDYEWGEQIAKYIAKLALLDREVIYPTKKEEIDLVYGRITVEQIRDLNSRTRVHQKPGKVYIIYKADSMTEQAQNAFLKVFEEPNPSTYFILLVNNQHSLLPTVISRSQALKIQSLNNEEATSLIPPNTRPAIKNQILFVANGNPVLINRLVKNPKDIEFYSKNIITAKEFLTADTYKKIILLNKFKDSREEAIATLEALIKIIDTSIKSPDKKLLKILNSALNARRDLKANYNVRLTLLYYLI